MSEPKSVEKEIMDWANDPFSSANRRELTDADVAFIKDASLSQLREELYYATGSDVEYAAALAKQILVRTNP